MSGHDEPRPDDAARDPHLQQALRHAPDAHVQAPAALAELILREARAKAGTPTDAAQPATAAPGWALRLWDWLARPAVATGLAGVMAATLVGLMWWDQPMDEALPRRPVPVADRAPAASLPSAPKPAPSIPTAAPPAATPAPAAAPPRPAPPRTPTPTPAPTPKPVPQEAATPLREEAPAAAPPEPPARAAAGDAAAHADTNIDTDPQRRSAAAKAKITESRAQRKAEASPRVASTPVASVRMAIASDPSRWTWEREGTSRPVNDGVLAWLDQLDASAGERWQPVDASMLRPGREVRLLHDGHLQHTFRFVQGGMLWWRPQGDWQQVTLPPASLNALETSAP